MSIATLALMGMVIRTFLLTLLAVNMNPLDVGRGSSEESVSEEGSDYEDDYFLDYFPTRTTSR